MATSFLMIDNRSRKWQRAYYSYIILLICVTTNVNGESSKNTFLPGTRAAGMGYAYTAVVGDNLSFFWNPAGLVISPRQQFSIGLARDRQNHTVPFYPQFVIFSRPLRGKGAWAVGGYAIQQASVRYAMGVAYARRLNRFIRFGLSLFHLPDFTRLPKRANQWGLSSGLIFQPNLRWRLGLLFHSTAEPIYSKEKNFKDHPWVQTRVGLAWRFIRPGLCALDYNPSNREVNFGLELKIVPFSAVRAGISSQVAKHEINQKFKDNLTLHAGLSFGGLDYAAVKSQNEKIHHAVSLHSDFGPIIRQIRIKPSLFETDPENIAGLHVLQTPNLLADIPKEVDYRLEEGQNLLWIQQQLGPFLTPECAEDTMAIQEYNELPADRILLPGQRLRLPLFQWTIHDSAKSDSIRWALDNALSVEPGHWPSQQNRGLLALKKGKLYEAEEHLGKAMTLASHKVQTLLSLAAFHLSENAWKEAHEVLSDAALLDSTNWRVHATLGYALLRKKGFQKAIQEFQKAISLGDSTVVTRYYLAECLQNQGHMDEADTIWLRLSHDYPEHLFGKLSALKHKRASSISGSSGSVSVVESPACRWVKPGMTRIMVIGVAGKISKNGMHLTETALKNKLGVSV